MCEQSSLAVQRVRAEFQGKQKAGDRRSDSYKRRNLETLSTLRNGRAQMQFRLEKNGKKQKDIKRYKKMFYCSPSMHKTGSTAADWTCDLSRGAQDAFCASFHQQSLTGLCTLKRAPRERPVDEHWAKDWLLEWTGSSQTHGGMKWALCKGDEAPGSYPCQNCSIFEWSGNRKKEGKHHIHLQKVTKTHTPSLILSNCIPGTSAVPRVSTGTCSLPHDPCHGGGDGNVLSSDWRYPQVGRNLA